MKVLRFVVIVMSFLLFCSIAYARLPDYGYIIGTLDRFAYLNKKNVSTPYGIEKTSMQGQFLHYYFWVDVNGISYECVIDIKNSILYNAPYRVINMRSSNSSLYGGILGQSSRSYNFENHNPNTPGNGGLDYIRHPGILKDMAGGRDWQENYRPEYSEIVNPYEQYTPLLYTGHEFEYDDAWDKLYVRHCDNNDDVCEVDLYYADAIDALFNNVSKIYVFGQFYDFGYGMHNIHQNQGNRYNNNTYISNGDIYQDGAVIFEYPDGKRKMLMVKFGDHNDNSGINMNMIDFTAPTAGEYRRYNVNGTLQNVYNKAGEGAPFYEETLWFDAREYPNGLRLGPYNTDQIEVVVDNNESDCMHYSDTDVYMSHSSNVSTSNYLIFARNNGCVNEYLRASSELWDAMNVSSNNRNIFYVFIYPWEPDSMSVVRVRYRDIEHN